MIKKVFYIGPVKDAPSDYKYWITRSYEERIAAVEILRKQFYGKSTPRLQRVYKIIKLKKS